MTCCQYFETLDVGDEVDFDQRVAGDAASRRDGRTHGRNLAPATGIDRVHLGPVVDVVEVDVDLEHLLHRRSGTDEVFFQLVEHMFRVLFDGPLEVCADTGQEQQVAVRDGA